MDLSKSMWTKSGPYRYDLAEHGEVVHVVEEEEFRLDQECVALLEPGKDVYDLQGGDGEPPWLRGLVRKDGSLYAVLAFIYDEPFSERDFLVLLTERQWEGLAAWIKARQAKFAAAFAAATDQAERIYRILVSAGVEEKTAKAVKQFVSTLAAD